MYIFWYDKLRMFQGGFLAEKCYKFREFILERLSLCFDAIIIVFTRFNNFLQRRLKYNFCNKK